MATGETPAAGLNGYYTSQYSGEEIDARLGSVDYKQPLLTGLPGQVVGFDASGAAQAVPGWSNQNLLDNGYFLDPVNQRGLTEYALDAAPVGPSGAGRAGHHRRGAAGGAGAQPLAWTGHLGLLGAVGKRPWANLPAVYGPVVPAGRAGDRGL